MAMARSTPKRRALSIQQVFLLLGGLNAVALGTILLSTWRLLKEPWSSTTYAYLTFFLAGLLVIGVAISWLIVSRRVVHPLRRLVREAHSIAVDETAIHEQLQVVGSDEIARLADAFNGVLHRQREAMGLLDTANQQLREVNKQVDDSIRYAALLQRSILPDRQLSERFGLDHFVLWQPRDTVGGDYYVFHDDGHRCLAGVADCAGHGVPGAMMTMLARAGIDRFIQQVGINSPAAILQATNAGMNMVLSEAQLSRALATSMDVGLVLLDFQAEILRFAGAKISLYWSDGQQVEVLKGDSRSLWDRRTGTYHDHEVPLRRDCTYYMATDGVFDQAGGELGFGLGTERFCDWLLAHATKPLAEQHEAFSRSISEFRGDHPQRDDITMLSFRIG